MSVFKIEDGSRERQQLGTFRTDRLWAVCGLSAIGCWAVESGPSATAPLADISGIYLIHLNLPSNRVDLRTGIRDELRCCDVNMQPNKSHQSPQNAGSVVLPISAVGMACYCQLATGYKTFPIFGAAGFHSGERNEARCH